MPRNPSPRNNTKPKAGALEKELETLREKNRELEETLDAIRSGEVDAIVVAQGDARQVYTLEGSDQPYRALVENIREGAITLSRAGLILYANTRFSEMVQIPPDKVMGTSLLEYVCPESQAEIVKALFEITKRMCRARVRIRQGNGSLPVLISMNPVSDREDTKISVVVTDRRKDEDRIQLQSRMLEAVGDAVIATDPDRKIIYWNNAATKTYGWDAEEVLGHDISEVKTRELPRKEDRKYRNDLARGLSWVGEYIGHHRNGHQFPVYGTDAPVFDNGGHLVAIIGASHDISAEKNAKEDLHNSLDRTATILESISDSFTALDRDWRITFMNQLALMYKGLSTGDVVGKTIWDVFPDLAGTQLEEVYRDVMKTRLPRTCINESVVSPGRIFEIHVYPMGDGGISIFGQEITERVQAEAALRESEKRYRELAETAGSIILRFDTQGRITYFNQFAETFFGFARNEILGKPAVGTIIPYRDSWGRDMEMMIRDIVAHPKQYEDNENENTRKNGERVWVRWTNKPIFNPDGTIREFTTIGNDITSQKRMEQALQASETRYRLAVQATNDAIWDLDIATGSVHWNDTYAVLYGRPPDSTVSWQWWVDHIHPDDRDRVLGGIQSAINGSESRWAAEYRFLKADGEWAYISDRAHIARDANGNPWRVIGAMQDLTDRKRVEEELKRRHDELNEMNAALVEAKEELNGNIVQLTRRESELKEALAEKEILLSEIHHRVKNNLAAFISLLSLDGTYEKTDAGQMLRQDLQNRARSMALIHETLYRTGKFSSVNMEVYLTTLIGQVARSYAGKTPVRTIVEAKGVTLDLARATTAGLIINELVTNSFKYAFPPGFDCQKERNEPCTVRVVFSCRTGEHRLTVSDNGTGLPPEIDPRTAKSLGLKLVTFLAKHQLRADIEVRADKGTSFIFNLNKPENNP